MKRNIPIFFSVLVCAAISMPPCADAANRKIFRARGSDVVLADLGIPCEGDVCSVKIVQAPAPGITGVVLREQVLAALAAQGVDGDGLAIPGRMRVRRICRKPSAQEFETRIREAIEALLPPGARISRLGRLEPCAVPVEQWEAEAGLPVEGELRGQVNVPITLVSRQIPFRRFKVSVVFESTVSLPVATRELNAGEVIAQDSFAVAPDVNVSRPERYASRSAEVVGRLLIHKVSEGSPFLRSALKDAPVVDRGSRVSVSSVVGNIAIKTDGVVREQGAIGEKIRVIVLSSNAVVWAHVVGPKDVEIR